MKNKNIFLNQKNHEIIQSPTRLLIIIIFSTIVSYILVSILIKILPSMEIWSEMLADSILLSIILFPILYFSVFRPLKINIAERKLAHEEILKLSLRQEAILAAVPEIIMEVDKNKIYTWANRSGLEFFGKDVIGQEASRYFEGEQETYNMVQPLFDGSKDISYLESWQRRYDGEKRLLAWWCKALKDNEGNVTGAFSSARDITERKQVEKELSLQGEIMKNITEGINLIRVKDEIIVFTNSKFDKMFGYYSEELIGKHVSILNAPSGKSPEEIKQDIVDTANRTGEWHGEILNIKKNGDHFWCYVNISMFDHPDYGKVYLSVHSDITERKQAEEELLESEDRFKVIASSTPDHILVQDNELRYTLVINPQLGLTEQDMLGKTDYDFLAKEEADKLYGVKRKVIEAGKPQQIETSLISKDGKPEFFGGTYIPKFDAQGKVNGLIGYFRNITERKREEEVLLESETRYRELFNNISSGVAIYEVTGNGNDFIFKDFNRAGERIDGDRKENIIGKSIYEVRPGINKFGLLEVFRRVFATGIPEHYPARFYKDEKLQGWYDNFVYRLPTGEIVTVYDDITERKQAEETIRILARFPSENPDPVLRVDRNGQLLYANEASYKLLTWKLQIGKKTPSVLQKIIAEAMKGGIGKKFDTEHKHRIITFNVVPIVEAGYANFYGHDITLRKQADEENIKSKKLLENLHKHLNEIRENERASISREIHDQIGQSLTALKLDLNQIHKYINANPEAVTKLESMVELILDTIKDVQRISSDLRPGILDELGLVSAIEWYCDEFEKRTGIKCILKLDDSDYSDSQINLTFFRVLQETLTNVIRHAKASSVNVKLKEYSNGTTLTIKDNGIGISKEEIESHKSLGLISMRERVRQFNGTIDISSKKGQGTKFAIYIPSKK